jgi:hypothetical protein
MRLNSYPKVWALGHPNTDGIFDGPVAVQEKIDGSQFSFGVANGELHLRSKGAVVFLENAGGLFGGAARTAHALHEKGLLKEGYVYRGEVIAKPKHNTLAYARVPEGNIILFDVDTGLERRMGAFELREEAKRIGLETVPTFYVGMVRSAKELLEFLERESILGGTKIEGVVVKNYAKFLEDGKQVMGKFVSEEFKERHQKEWKRGNPGGKDLVEHLAQALRTEARWEKAVQRRRDAGELENSPRDIGPLIKSVQEDIAAEEEAWVKQKLWEANRKQIFRRTTAGLADWYKERLLKRVL